MSQPKEVSLTELHHMVEKLIQKFKGKKGKVNETQSSPQRKPEETQRA